MLESGSPPPFPLHKNEGSVVLVYDFRSHPHPHILLNKHSCHFVLLSIDSIRHVTVLGRLFIHRSGALQANSALFIHPGSVNEDQLRLWSQRQVWFILFLDKRVCVHLSRDLTVFTYIYIPAHVQIKPRSLDNACHTWALLQRCSLVKSRYIKFPHLNFYLCLLYVTATVTNIKAAAEVVATTATIYQLCIEHYH